MKRKLMIAGAAFCAALFLFSGIMLFREYHDQKQSAEAFEQVAALVVGESTPEEPESEEAAEPEMTAFEKYAEVFAQNDDLIGWISIPGTCVDYPVLQSSADEPEYYLRRTYKGEHRTAGSIFFQWDCSPESRNLVVYGHNMSDGTMFAVLQKMADEAFRTEHSKILLQTSDGLREYRIAAVLKTDIQKFPFNRTEFADDADFLSFQKELFAQSLCKTETIPGADRRLLTLVTCSYEWESARTVVIATAVR